MLSWFKKKFAKKETDQQPSEADLKIPVALRPEPPVIDQDTAADIAVEQPAVSEREGAEVAAEPEATDAALPERPGDDEIAEASPPTAEPVVEIERSSHELADATEGETDDTAEPPAVRRETVNDDDRVEPVTQEGEDTSGSPLPEETLPHEDGTQESAAPLEQADRQAPAAFEAEPAETVADRPETGSETDKKVETKPAVKKKSFLSRLSERLSRTRESFTYQLDTLFLGRKEIDGKLLDDLEELLITADLGMKVTTEVLDHARRKVKRKELSDPQSLKLVLKAKLRSFIEEHQEDASLVMPEEGPFVIMVVGVNGVGKTTTIGKIAHKFLRSGQSVLLVAADTFRAAAVSQLKIWGERNQVPVIAKEEGADPSAVVYDGIAHAKAKGYDVVLVDTAGRLHTQSKLMDELKKIKRVMGKQLEGAPHEVMLVIDATTGQNGISQAKLFNEAVALTGITLTKLDGTAKGGIVINIGRELQLPIRFIGVGEQLDDLRDFEPDEFIDALFQSGDQSRT